MRCISTFYRSAQRRRQACSIPPEWMLNLSGRAAQSRAEYSARKAKSLSQMQFASFLHMSVNSYGNIERGIQKISLLRLFQLCKLFDVRPESVLHNCCPELVGKEDELPLTDNQESNALLQRIATCSTAELQFFVDQLPALRQFKPKR